MRKRNRGMMKEEDEAQGETVGEWIYFLMISTINDTEVR